MNANVRVYEPLRDPCDLLSSYYKLTKWNNLRKPSPSNDLYTLLWTVVFQILIGIQLVRSDR